MWDANNRCSQFAFWIFFPFIFQSLTPKQAVSEEENPSEEKLSLELSKTGSLGSESATPVVPVPVVPMDLDIQKKI